MPVIISYLPLLGERGWIGRIDCLLFFFVRANGDGQVTGGCRRSGWFGRLAGCRVRPNGFLNQLQVGLVDLEGRELKFLTRGSYHADGAASG